MSSGASQLSSLAQAPLAGPDRRTEVLTTALLTFARFGYRKTSMDDIAKAARISRPGLYFLFASKEELFREAASRALEDDVADAESILADSTRPLDDRVLDAFDRWAGRYVGPMAADVSIVIADNPAPLHPSRHRRHRPQFKEVTTRERGIDRANTDQHIHRHQAPGERPRRLPGAHARSHRVAAGLATRRDKRPPFAPSRTSTRLMNLL